jgi:hypothetical protein
MTPDSTRPVAYFPRYLTPAAAAAVAEAEAEDLGAGPVPYALTRPAEAAIEDKEIEAGT